MRSASADTLHKSVHKLRPLVSWEFDGSDGGDDLSGSLAGLRVTRRQCLQGKSLDLILRLLIRLLKPFCLQLLGSRELSGTEGVL